MSTYTLSIIVEGQDRASGPLGGISNALGKIGTIAAGILTADIFRNLGQGIVNFGSQAISATAQMQAFEMGLQTLLTRELRTVDETLSMNDAFAKAAPLAGQLAAKLKDIAIQSPYELGTVQDTFRLAMAFGFASNEAESFTKGVLNMAAGVGASNEMLGRMAYNFAQIRMQGKVTAVDVRQLAMAGFDLNSALVDIAGQFGVTIKDFNGFNAAIASGKIKWADFAGAFEKYADKNFGGAAARMSRTFQGLQSTFKDFFLLTMPAVLGPALQSVTDFLNKILNEFMRFAASGALEDWGKSLGEFLDNGLGKMDYLMKLLGRIRTFGLKALTPLSIRKLFGDDVDPQQIIGKVKTVIEGIKNAFLSIPALGGAGVTGIFAGIAGAGLAGPIIGALGGLGPALLAAGSGLAGSLFSGLLVGLSRLSPMLGGAFFRLFMSGGVAESVGAALTGIFGKMGGFLKFLAPLAPLVGGLLGAFALGVVALTAFGVAMKVLSGDTKFFDVLLGNLQDGLGNFGQFWQEQGPAIAEIGQKVFAGIVDAGNTLAEAVLPWLVAQFQKFSQWFVDNGPLITKFVEVLADFFTNVLLPAIVNFWSVLQPTLTAILDGIGGLATAVMQIATGDWAGAWETMKGVAVGLWTGIQESWTAFVAWVTGWFGSSWPEVTATWGENWTLLQSITQQIWDNITLAIQTWWTDLWANFAFNMAAFWALITLGWSTTWQITVTKWTEITSAIVGKLAEIAGNIAMKLEEMKAKWVIGLANLLLSATTKWTEIKSMFETKIAEIVAHIYNKAQAMYNAGQNMFAGLFEGIRKKTKEIMDYVKQVAADIAAAFAAVMAIKSPSQVFAGFGMNMMAGLAEGINNNSGMAISATQRAGNDVTGAYPTSYATGGQSSGAAAPVTFNVDGSKDPEETARAIYKLLKAQGLVA